MWVYTYIYSTGLSNVYSTVHDEEDIIRPPSEFSITAETLHQAQIPRVPDPKVTLTPHEKKIHCTHQVFHQRIQFVVVMCTQPEVKLHIRGAGP